MKYLYIILSFAILSKCFSQTYTYEWVSKVKFKDAIYPGKKYVIKQMCQPKADSIASNGKITFWSSSIGGIKEVTLSYLIKDTILLSTELITKGKDNCKMLSDKISELTSGKEAFVHYGVGKTLYKIYLFTKDEINYLMYYDYSTNLKNGHVLIIPRK